MKTEYRNFEEAGVRQRMRCWTVVPLGFTLEGPRRRNVRKKHKAGDAVGRRSGESSFLDDPGAQFFYRKRATGRKRKETARKRDPENSGRASYSCFSSLAEPLAAARSGPGRAVFLARRQRTLDGEDRCKTIGEGGKDLFSRMPDRYHNGGTNHE